MAVSSVQMIESFADEGTEDIWNRDDTKAARKTLGKELWPIAVRKLSMLDAAVAPKDLKSPPGNNLEQLKGKLSGKWSIRINQQFRIVFAFEQGAATHVEITDYH